ncbi:MAG: hypothetical protein ACE5E5_07100 [Phycisphaerae bacterium]
MPVERHPPDTTHPPDSSVPSRLGGKLPPSVHDIIAGYEGAQKVCSSSLLKNRFSGVVPDFSRRRRAASPAQMNRRWQNYRPDPGTTMLQQAAKKAAFHPPELPYTLPPTPIPTILAADPRPV